MAAGRGSILAGGALTGATTAGRWPGGTNCWPASQGMMSSMTALALPILALSLDLTLSAAYRKALSSEVNGTVRPLGFIKFAARATAASTNSLAFVVAAPSAGGRSLTDGGDFGAGAKVDLATALAAALAAASLGGGPDGVPGATASAGCSVPVSEGYCPSATAFLKR